MSCLHECFRIPKRRERRILPFTRIALHRKVEPLHIAASTDIVGIRSGVPDIDTIRVIFSREDTDTISLLGSGQHISLTVSLLWIMQTVHPRGYIQSTAAFGRPSSTRGKDIFGRPKRRCYNRSRNMYYICGCKQYDSRL